MRPCTSETRPRFSLYPHRDLWERSHTQPFGKFLSLLQNFTSCLRIYFLTFRQSVFQLCKFVQGKRGNVASACVFLDLFFGEQFLD